MAKTYELVYRDGWEKYYNDPDHVSRGYLESKTEDITSCFQMLNKEGYSFKEIMDAYGYDGIIDGHVFIVVRPNQIKSINNKGTWSKTSDNIYESLNRKIREVSMITENTIRLINSRILLMLEYCVEHL